MMSAPANKHMYFMVPEISNHDDGARVIPRNFELTFRIGGAIGSTVRNMLIFSSECLLVSRQTQIKDHRLSGIRDCLIHYTPH